MLNFFYLTSMYVNFKTFCFFHLLPQRHEDSLVYSAPTFSRRKAGKKTGRGNVKPADEETVYSDVRTYA